MPGNERRITIILFDQFQLLDVFGPVELISKVPGVTVDYAGPVAGPGSLTRFPGRFLCVDHAAISAAV